MHNNAKARAALQEDSKSRWRDNRKTNMVLNGEFNCSKSGHNIIHGFISLSLCKCFWKIITSISDKMLRSARHYFEYSAGIYTWVMRKCFKHFPGIGFGCLNCLLIFEKCILWQRILHYISFFTSALNGFRSEHQSLLFDGKMTWENIHHFSLAATMRRPFNRRSFCNLFNVFSAHKSTTACVLFQCFLQRRALVEVHTCRLIPLTVYLNNNDMSLPSCITSSWSSSTARSSQS